MSTTTTALISGGVSLLVAGVTTAGAYLLQRTRLRDDLRQQDRRLQAELERQREKAADDLRQQEHRLFAELRTEFMAEAAIRQLLTLPDWELRSFAAIRERIGGFRDDELRRLLVRSGAVRFKGAGDTEMWGLRERNAARLGRSGDGPAGPRRAEPPARHVHPRHRVDAAYDCPWPSHRQAWPTRRGDGANRRRGPCPG